MEPIELRAEQPVEYFREMVDAAIAHQRVMAAADTAAYVAKMLAGFVRADARFTVMSVRVADGAAPSLEQQASLQQVGDVSLFVAGFFADSLHRSWLGAGDLARIGGAAYLALSRGTSDERSHVFAELARRFSIYVDVLEEVSERSASTSDLSLLRLYGKWLRTRNNRTEAILIERGLVPGRPGGRPN